MTGLCLSETHLVMYSRLIAVSLSVSCDNVHKLNSSAYVQSI